MLEAAALRRVPLFAGLTSQDLEVLAAGLRRRSYPKGQTIFAAGDPGESLCLIESGRVKLAFTSAEGREVVLDVLGPGEVFGELALLDGEPRSADAVALEPTSLQLVGRTEFVHFLEHRPRAAIALLGLLGRRLRRDAQLLQDGVFLDVPARLARALLRLAQPGAEGRLRTPRLTQRDLAGLVGTTRETLNKWLGVYQDEQLIRLEAGYIVVLEPERLRRRIT